MSHFIRHQPRVLQFIIVSALVCASAAWTVLPKLAAPAALITVNTTTDEYNADGDCSLREAIVAANTDAGVDACPAGDGADTISLPAGTYTLTVAGANEEAALTGDLDVTADLTIDGASRLTTTIDAAGNDRVFDIIGSQTDMQLSNLKIANGNSATTAGSGIRLTGGTLQLVNSRLTNNTGVGGIYVSAGAITVTNSRIDNNSESAIILLLASSAAIVNSDISNNARSGNNGGGGIASVGGAVTVVNSTISGNASNGSGGGIFSNGGTVRLYNVTLSNNTSDSDADDVGDGGGLYVIGLGLTVRNTIVGGNFDNSPVTQHPDCSGLMTSDGYNLISNTTGCTISGNTLGNIIGVSPNLGPLQLNGGDTRTQALLAGSPAIEGGDPANWCVDQNNNLLYTDQRGYARNGLCDIGAYEYLSPGTPTPTNPPTQTPTPTLTRTPTPSATMPPSPTHSGGGVATSTPAGTATQTLTPVPTCTPGIDSFCTPTPTPSRTPTTGLTLPPPQTNTPEASPTVTHTPTAGPSPTAPALTGYQIYLPLVQR